MHPGKFKADNSAFLFNLTSFLHFPSKGATGKDIYCCSGQGPCFVGESSCELAALREPFNGNNKCASVADEPGYKIPKVNGKNQLTSSKDIWFTISELEVWLLDDEQ